MVDSKSLKTGFKTLCVALQHLQKLIVGFCTRTKNMPVVAGHIVNTSEETKFQGMLKIIYFQKNELLFSLTPEI